MKAKDCAYYGFEKDVDVDEVVEWTSTETEADTYDKYIDSELQIPDADGMKWMARFRQILRDVDVNPEVTGNYRAWEDHIEYEIEFCDRSTSKITENVISKNMLSMVDSSGRHFPLHK